VLELVTTATINVVRTSHPHSSVAAWGEECQRITEVHQLEERFGNSSPLGVLYELDAQVLFLGTGYDTNTCFHLAEYRRPNPPKRKFQIVRGVGDDRKLIRYADVDTNSGLLEAIGSDFEAASPIETGRIGAADCRFFNLRAAVDFATDFCPILKSDSF